MKESALDNTQVLPPSFIDKARDRDIKEKGRIKSFRLRSKAAEIIGGRLAKCGKIPFKKSAKYVDVICKDQKHYYYSGLVSCGSVWACPVCSLKISQHRAEKLTYYLKHIQTETNYKIGFLTLTIRHNLSENLRENKHSVLNIWRNITKSRKYRELSKKYKILGNIRALEVKFSFSTGWHPHLHILFIADENQENLEKFNKEIINIWIQEHAENSKAEKTGQKYVPVLCEKGISEYITKYSAADEITRSYIKTGQKDKFSFTPFDMLQYIENNEFNKALEDNVNKLKNKFREFVENFKATKQLTYSRSLLLLFNNLIDNKTDEEIVTEKQENEKIVLSIEKTIFEKIIKYKIEADILNIIQFENTNNLILFLREFGIFTLFADQIIKKAPQ